MDSGERDGAIQMNFCNQIYDTSPWLFVHKYIIIFCKDSSKVHTPVTVFTPKVNPIYVGIVGHFIINQAFFLTLLSYICIFYFLQNYYTGFI